ncbi:MAG TPA: hypothetical protein PKA90_05505 [Ignavibacteria bacterium]|nr:hypothetical protein [Ignavibacteria bacterium]HMR39868.1 hypothetical protein [Ignavibacteria bacterium]
MKQFILLVLISTFFLFQINGCGKKEETSGASNEEQNETLNNTDPGNKSSEMNKEDEIRKDPLASENTTESQLEMEPGLPSDFPADVPQYTKAKLIGSLNSSDGMMVTYESNDQVQDIIDFYKAGMTKSGYQVEEGGEIITPGKGGLINWIKQGKSVQIVLGYDKDKGLSSFVITYK